MDIKSLAAHIQHSNVKRDATLADIEKLLNETIEYRFQCAAVTPIWAELAINRLKGTGCKVCVGVDFPHSTNTVTATVFTITELHKMGVDEFDIVTKVGWLKSKMYSEYKRHLHECVKAAEGKITKAIIEVDLLTNEELPVAVELCAEAGVDYLKNSSGFGGGVATPELVKKLRELSNGRLKIKAIGGIKTYDQAMKLIEAGADVIASSNSPNIIATFN